MSYRTIKRVLGETNLERKCRWWFGTSLFILLSLSFSWYGRRTDTIVKELNPKFIGPELVRAGWLEVHLAHLADIGRIQRGQRADGTGAAGGGRNEFEDDFYRRPGEKQPRLGPQVQMGRDSSARLDLNRPCRKSIARRDALRREVAGGMGGAARAGLEAPLAGQASGSGAGAAIAFRWTRLSAALRRRGRWRPFVSILSADVRRTTRASTATRTSAAAGRGRTLQAGDLMAMIRVTTDYGPTAAEVAKNQALLWTAAIVVGFVSMFSLWAVVRYVIVKPVTHLRDVANAVREGDVEQRAVDSHRRRVRRAGAAFNRMLRQLLSQQSELRQSQERAGRAARRAGPGQHAAVRNEPAEERLPGHREPRAAHAAQQHSRLQRRAERRRCARRQAAAVRGQYPAIRAGCCWK